MNRKRALTLVEVLIVVGILLLLAAILIPVLLRARESGNIAACTSNLHQVAMAFEAYAQANDDKLPEFLPAIQPYLGSLAILKCPSDHWGGVQESESAMLGSAVSYYYPRMFLFKAAPGDWEIGRNLLQQADPDHGVVVCPLHGELDNPAAMNGPPLAPMNAFKGLTLRARRDGSVQRVQIEMVCMLSPQGSIQGGRRDWDFSTDVRPCPPEVCGTWPTVPCP